jgi:GNAT superfamily N-acetyltransferase
MLGGVRSLGYLTDLYVLVAQGSGISVGDGYLAVRTPDNPRFHWGNFLLLGEPPRPGSVPGWIDRFNTEFPGAGHIALGVDGITGAAGSLTELAAAGLTVNRDSVLTASAVTAPENRHRDAVVRPLSSDQDWLAGRNLRVAAGGQGDGRIEFLTAKVAAERRMTDSGQAVWFGAFLGGRLCATAGLVADDKGLARYQNVVTLPEVRRQGLAGRLVYDAGRHALDVLGARRLVMVAEPDSDAIRLYRSIGFADTERQTGIERQIGPDRPAAEPPA